MIFVNAEDSQRDLVEVTNPGGYTTKMRVRTLFRKNQSWLAHSLSGFLKKNNNFDPTVDIFIKSHPCEPRRSNSFWSWTCIGSLLLIFLYSFGNWSCIKAGLSLPWSFLLASSGLGNVGAASILILRIKYFHFWSVCWLTFMRAMQVCTLHCGQCRCICQKRWSFREREAAVASLPWWQGRLLVLLVPRVQLWASSENESPWERLYRRFWPSLRVCYSTTLPTCSVLSVKAYRVRS